MSPDTSAVSGSPATAVPSGSGQTTDVADAPGRLLRRISVLPVLVVMAWLLVGLPLLLAGWLKPILMLAAAPLAATLLIFGLRRVPDGWRTALPAPKPARAPTPWWAVAGVLAVAAVFAAQQMIYHSQQIMVVRDPASYVQYAAWIAHHGSLPIPQSRAAFGGTHGTLRFGSPGFYQVGRAVVPEFMTGLPLVLAAGFWIGGVATAVALAPLLGAGAVLTFGGLAARLAGPRWAPPAALALALSLPEQFTSRSTYSEPLAQILLLGGLCLVCDSFELGRAGARTTAALGGLALGLTLLVRIDGASDILPMVPYCGLLFLARRPQALPLFGGVAAGALFGAVDGLVLSRAYLHDIRHSLYPLAAVTSVVVIVTIIAVAALWNYGLPEVRWKWLLNAASASPLLLLLAFVIRPHLYPVPRGANPQARIMSLRAMHPYFAMSLDWVFWYIGVPAVVLGAFGAALLVRKCLTGSAPSWTLPLMIFGWIIVTVLYRPAIVPHQPWASRRLVPGVLPGFILLAVWASAWLVSWLRQHDFDRAVPAALASGCAAALLLPPAITTFGPRISDGRPVAVGLAFKTTYRGELAAVDHLCRAIPHGSAVVIVDRQIGGRLAQLIRGMCGDPAAITLTRSLSAVNQVIHGIERAGRKPVILAGRPSLLEHYRGVPRKIMDLRTRGDEILLTAPPLGTLPIRIGVWMSEPAP